MKVLAATTLLLLLATTGAVSATASVTTWLFAPGFSFFVASSGYDVNAPPAVTITLKTEGEGDISPFVGAYYMPMFDVDEWRAWVQHGAEGAPEEYCAILLLEDVTATPTDDWVFLHWQVEAGSISEIMDYNEGALGTGLTLKTPTIDIPLTHDVTLRAVFDHRPWFTNLDLVRSLEAFLLQYNQIDDPEELLAFDRGTGQYDYGEYTYHGDGIPDAALMLLLEELLKNPEHRFSPGVWAPNVLKDFMTNRALALRILDDVSEDIISVTAAYLTLGGLDYPFWLCDEALNISRKDIRGAANTAGRNLRADKSADGGRFSNLEQWKWVLETNEYPPMRIELARRFVETVLDPDVPPEDWTSTPDKQHKPHRGVWNDPHIPLGNVIIGDDIEAHVIDPGGGADLPISDVTAVPLGRRIRVKYVGEPGWFSQWSAPGTLLNGSNKEETVFVHVHPDQQVEVVYLDGVVAPIP